MRWLLAATFLAALASVAWAQANLEFVPVLNAMVSQSVTITGISPTSCSVNTGSAPTSCATISVTLSSGSFTGTQTAVASGGGCSGGDATDFSFTGNVLYLTNAGLAAGPYKVCDQVSQTGVTTAYFAITVTVSPSGGVPSAPAAATAGCSAGNGGGPSNGSCFNVLVLNLDMTGATQSQFRGTNFTPNPISNWMGGCGSTSLTAMYNAGFIVGPGPCSNYSIITDGGKATLKITHAGNPSGYGIELQLMNSSFSGGVSLPEEFYTQATFRTDSTTDTSCSSHGYCIDYWTYSVGGNTLEQDFIEFYSNMSDSGVLRCCSPYPQYPSSPPGVNSGTVPGYNHDNYYTFGWRSTADGAGHWGVCNYVNGTQIGCVNNNIGAPGGGGSWTGAPTNLQLQAAYGTGAAPVSMYLQDLQIWDCSNWTAAIYPLTNGDACDGVVLTTNP